MARLFLALMIAVFAGGRLDALEIRLLESVRIEGARITLGDITEPGGAAEWSAVVVARFEGEELERVVRYGEVVAAIRQATGKPFFLIGSSVTVRRASMVVRREDMSGFVRRELARRRSDAVLELDLTLLPAVREFAGNAVSMRLETGEAVPASGPWQGRLVFVRDGTDLGGIEIRGQLRVPGRVLVAARDCFGGTVPGPEDMRLEPVDDIGDPALHVTAAMIKGRRLLADIKRGTRLTQDLFERPLIVRRGMRVDVVWRRSGVLIEAPAEVLEDGRAGDVIRLRNPHTAREFRAMIREESGKVYADG